MTKSKNKLPPRTKWTEEMDAILRKEYPHKKTRTVAALLGVTESICYSRATKRLGLKKTQEYLQSPDACRLRRGDNVGAAYRYPKGHIPANKGRKGWCPPGSEATQFKPGQTPVNIKPIGSTRICSKDGYILIKMREGLRAWDLLHKVIYERMHGPVPYTHVVTFNDGNKLNVSILNLRAISKKENVLRNGVHSYGPEIAQLYQLKGQITRQINKQEKSKHE